MSNKSTLKERTEVAIATISGSLGIPRQSGERSIDFLERLAEKCQSKWDWNLKDGTGISVASGTVYLGGI